MILPASLKLIVRVEDNLTSLTYRWKHARELPNSAER